MKRGPKGSLYLLGATALEAFGVEADSVGKRLKPVPAVIGAFLAAGLPRGESCRPAHARAESSCTSASASAR